MKVLLLGSKEYPFGSSHKYDKKAGGGIEIHVDRLAKFLAREGHDAYIITRQFPGQKKEEIFKIGNDGKIHVYRTQFIYNPILRAMSYNFFASIKALKIIRKEKIDAIHCHGPVAGFFGAKLSKITGRPMIFTPHGTVTTWSSPIKEILRFFENTSALSAKKTIFISKKAQKEMTAVMKFPNTLLTNAIDLDNYESKVARTQTKRFLFVGRLEEVKGLREIMEAFTLLTKKHPDSKLTIAGDGAMRKYIEDFIRKNSTKNINFVGWVDSDKIPKLLSEHDVFLLPSEEKGQPVALLEAMASGAIIITSLDYIDDNSTGVKVRARDVSDLLEKMNYVYEHPETTTFGQNAKNMVKNVSWDVVIKMFVEEYKRI